MFRRHLSKGLPGASPRSLIGSCLTLPLQDQRSTQACHVVATTKSRSSPSVARATADPRRLAVPLTRLQVRGGEGVPQPVSSPRRTGGRPPDHLAPIKIDYSDTIHFFRIQKCPAASPHGGPACCVGSPQRQTSNRRLHEHASEALGPLPPGPNPVRPLPRKDSSYEEPYADEASRGNGFHWYLCGSPHSRLDAHRG